MSLVVRYAPLEHPALYMHRQQATGSEEQMKDISSCSYVGKRRLDKALELNKDRANFKVQW